MNRLVSDEYLKILRESCEGCINNAASTKYHSCISPQKGVLDQALSNLFNKNLITLEQIQLYKCKAYLNIHLPV